MIARPDRRALVLVGDGAFQMTGTELATHCRLGLAPIVIVFNNCGYSTERFILDGPFNDISDWCFDRRITSPNSILRADGSRASRFGRG